jgi:hypothetical protein
MAPEEYEDMCKIQGFEFCLFEFFVVFDIVFIAVVIVFISNVSHSFVDRVLGFV